MVKCVRSKQRPAFPEGSLGEKGKTRKGQNRVETSCSGVVEGAYRNLRRGGGDRYEENKHSPGPQRGTVEKKDRRVEVQ